MLLERSLHPHIYGERLHVVKSKQHHAVCDLFAHAPYLPQGLYRLTVVAGLERIKVELTTCRDVVATGRYPYTGRLGVLRGEDQRIVDEAMETVHALELAERDFNAISDGQRQRVLLARALCATRKLLLLDEPVTGLDPVATEELYNLIKRVNLCNDITVIMVTHDMRGALREAHTILHIGRDGWFFGTVAEYLASPAGKRFGGVL